MKHDSNGLMRISRVMIFLCLALFTLTLVQGCGDDSSAIFETRLTLRNADGQAVTTFPKGEPSAQLYGFFVFRVDEDSLPLIWQSNQPTICLRTPLLFSPQEMKTFSEEWDQRDNSNILVSLGDFEAQGFVATLGNTLPKDFRPSETRSAFVPFTIQ